MTIVNRRNAVVGFVTIKVGKRVARRKAKQVGGRLTPSWASKNGKRGAKQSSKS
jgi:hypothetical protein